MGWQLNHVEVFLSDQVPFHSEPELVAPGGRENQRGDVDPEVRDLQSIADDDIRERGATHELFCVEIDQVDIKLVGTFRIGEAEIETHLLMLEGEAQRLQVSEQSDEALLLGHAVLDDLVTDQERLNAGLRNVRHTGYCTRVPPAVKGICLSCGSWSGGHKKKGGV